MKNLGLRKEDKVEEVDGVDGVEEGLTEYEIVKARLESKARARLEEETRAAGERCHEGGSLREMVMM